MMNQEVKELWMEALVSGEYTQTKHALQNEEGFCCLGVLCDLYAKSHSLEWGEYSEYYDGTTYHIPYRFLGCDEFLPEEVRHWAKLDYEDPAIQLEDRTTLSTLNDKGYSFKNIAELIQKQL